MSHEPGAKPKVVLTHWVHPETVHLLEPSCRVVMHPDRDSTLAREVLLREHADAAALMAFMTDWVDDALLAGLPRLRIVAGALKGADSLAPQACERRGVWVTVVPDLLTLPTAELTVALLLGLARHLAEADAWVRSGRFVGWRPRLFGTLLAGCTVGLLGMGAIGQAIAARLRGFDVHLLFHDLHLPPAAARRTLGAEFRPLEHLPTECDVVVLALPLTEATTHLVDAAFLARMRPGALLVNPARGSLVDEAAVADALASGQLGGYAADTFAFEDWVQPGRPAAIHPALLAQRERTLFTPHLGSAVDGVRREITLHAARSIQQALAGQQPDGALNNPRPAQP
jgi:phosphonate dehydrogenase